LSVTCSLLDGSSLDTAPLLYGKNSSTTTQSVL
jgi:hypothetical protein